jgi:hypothetical protein
LGDAGGDDPEVPGVAEGGGEVRGVLGDGGGGGGRAAREVP